MNRDVRGVFASLLFLLCFLSFPVSAATRWDNPLPQGNVIAGVSWNGARYVAVGNAGTVLESTDGIQWNQVNSGTTEWLQSIRWTGSQFIVVGNSATILTSPDGLQWTRQSSARAGFLYGVEYAPQLNLHVAVGASGTIITSPDGIHWTRRVSNADDDWLNDITWNGSEFLAVGGRGAIVASADGVNWARRVPPVRTVAADGTASGPDFDGVAWSPTVNRWVVVSDYGCTGEGACILSSDDGITWTVRATSAVGMRAVIWNADQARFVAVGANGLVRSSNDGITWSPLNLTGFSEAFEAVAFGGAGFVAAGEHGVILGTANPAGAWTRRTTGPLSRLWSIATNGQGYVAVGQGIIFHTPDAANTLPQPITGQPALRGIAWGALPSGQNGYLAVGNGGAVLSSVNGTTWASESSPGAGDLRAVTRAADGWVVGGANGNIWRNAGAGWESLRAGSADETINAISADGLLAAGTRLAADPEAVPTGFLLTRAANGNQWMETAFQEFDLRGVARGGGRVVAVGSQGAFATLIDSAWTVGNVGSAFALNGVAWDGRRFIAVGDLGNTFVSSDGLHWERQRVTGNTLGGITTLGVSFIAVGEGGTIVQTSCPCALDDTASTSVNTPVTIAVLANDQGNDLEVRAFDLNTAQGGSITLNGDGTLTFTPAKDFIGTDVFNYTIGSRGDARSEDTATVTVVVDGRSVGPGGSGNGGGGGGSAAYLLGLLMLAAAARQRAAKRT